MKKQKSALITGITGQDGAYLANFLLKKNYRVFGTFRRISSPNFWRLLSLNIGDKIELIPADLIDDSSLKEAVRISDPDEVYHLAAQSYVGTSFDQPITSGEFSGLAVARMLESVRQYNPKIKFYQASSSEMYGNVKSYPQNEMTVFSPQSPYASAKVYGYHLTQIYRDGYGMFACNGILFNHESPLRGLEFVTKKIVDSMLKIKNGDLDKLTLGNIDTERDWGFAGDYVECMWKMLQTSTPTDFIISTGKSYSVKEFLTETAKICGIKNWRNVVKFDNLLRRQIDYKQKIGDSSKAKKILKWTPKTTFEDLIRLMIENKSL